MKTAGSSNQRRNRYTNYSTKLVPAISDSHLGDCRFQTRSWWKNVFESHWLPPKLQPSLGSPFRIRNWPWDLLVEVVPVLTNQNSSIPRWKSRGFSARTFIWICFFCNNQASGAASWGLGVWFFHRWKNDVSFFSPATCTRCNSLFGDLTSRNQDWTWKYGIRRDECISQWLISRRFHSVYGRFMRLENGVRPNQRTQL